MVDLDIRSLSLEEAFNTLKTLDDGTAEYHEIEEKAIRGINIKFSLFDYLYKRPSITEKGRNGKVIIRGKIYKLEDYDEELMEREKLIKEFLIEKLEGRQIAKVRGTK